jgi:hypothetical protein
MADFSEARSGDRKVKFDKTELILPITGAGILSPAQGRYLH